MVDAVRTTFGGDPDLRRRVAFSVAMIALSAKMAKADGIVTQDEIRAFHQIFEIPASERRNVARLYHLAQQDVAGFEAYAERIRRLFPDRPELLEDIIDVLFNIAAADGVLHEREQAFLDRVAEIFALDPVVYNKVQARYVVAETDPYEVLEADPSMSYAELRRRYLELVGKHHPDRLLARGVPAEFVRIGNDRLAEINTAWEAIARQRRGAGPSARSSAR
jgi:DnaJ like chaperone protein